MAKDYKCHGEMTRRGEFLRWNVNSAFGGLVGPRTVWRWVGSAQKPGEPRSNTHSN